MKGDEIMKKFKRILATILAVIFCFNISVIPTYAADVNDSTISDFPLAGTSEIVEIEGTNYKYDYYLEDGMRKVDITNMSTNTMDRIVYNPSTYTMYLNGSIFSTKTEPLITPYSLRTTADGWEIVSTDSHYISWAEGTSVAVIAGMIAAALGFGVGGAAIIGAIGFEALSVLAAASTGGTVYVELHMFTAPFAQPQYRYMWTFTASTGDKYGPFYNHVYF